MPRKLVVEIVGDSKSYERALGRSSKATNAFRDSVGATNPRLGKLNQLSNLAGGGMIYAAGAAAGLAVAVGAKAVTAASDLNEQLSRTEVILGSSSDEMIKWSETTATAMGISQRQALASAATFAGLFQTVGVAQQEAGEFSRVLVQLAADLASLGNTSPEEALVALRSGLSGEAEPLRRFNIFLTEASVQQEALLETGKKTTAALTQQEKTLARYNLILQQSAPAQGNFALTSGGLANQQRILAAQVDDLSTKLGKVLVPAVTAVVGALNDAITTGEDLAGVLGKLADIPGIEIPIKLVSSVTGGNAGFILRHIVLGGISPLALGVTIGKEIADGIRQGSDDSGAVVIRPGPISVGREHAAGRLTPAEREARAQAARDVKTGQATIDRITRQANAQKSLNQQIAESETRAAHLRDLIRQDPTNTKLQQRLSAEIKKQNDLAAEQVRLNKSNAEAVRQTAEAQKQSAKAAAEARKEAERAATEARRNAETARQFKAIGLTAEGLRPTPGGGSLLRRTLGLEQQIKGTILDTPKTKSQLKKIREFLKKNMGDVKRDVREAILDMLNGISDALEGKDGTKTGPLTQTHGIRSAQIIKNLGLTAEQADEIQRRLAHGTTTLGRRTTTAPGGSKVPGQRGPSGETFTANVNVYIDGKKVANTVTRHQQKDRRRNPRQKRGTHRN